MSEACPECVRRAWLLGRLGVPLDFRVRDLTRFWRMLELDDEDLIAVIGGRRRDEMAEEYCRLRPIPTDKGNKSAAICIHQPAYPRSLSQHALAPRAHRHEPLDPLRPRLRLLRLMHAPQDGVAVGAVERLEERARPFVARQSSGEIGRHL